MDHATRWRTRVTWALVGAGVTLAIMSLREHGASEASVEARVGGSTPQAAEAPVGDPPASAHVDATPVGDPLADFTPPQGAPLLAVADGSLAAADPIAEPSAATPPESDAAAAAVAPAASTTAPPTGSPPAAEPFEIPLSLMPGARIMSRSQRPDPEHGGTIYTLALSVPAPGVQVEPFYRAALGDAKLAVSGGSTQPSTMGTGHRSSLRGRSRDARVNVNLRQPAGKLRTIVRIIWQTLP